MAENTDFVKTLTDALEARRNWIDGSELTKLKDELRTFQMSFSALYTMYLKKGLINEDPYKQEAKIAELEVPEASAFSEAERVDQLSIRLANYDNQLDFLVNFYQFNTEFLNLDRIKRILGLVKYIDWSRLSTDSQQPNTKAVAEITNQVKVGIDPLALNVIGESQTKLGKSTPAILGYLKTLTDYHKELYKLNLRQDVIAGMSPAEAVQINLVKKKFAQACPGKPFYTEMADAVLKEDYSKEGPALREEVLKALVVADNKPKNVVVEVSYKAILLDGIQGLGSTAAAFTDILLKLEENQALLDNRKLSFWEKVKKIVAQALNKEPEPTIYEVEYMDPLKGKMVKEQVNVSSFRANLERRTRSLMNISSRGSATAKLEAMEEEQLIQFLERNIREIQSSHKTLSALDEYFKSVVDKGDREKVRGIKPELATIKNAIIRANQKRHEYSAQKEEAEQLKRLGVSPAS
jgi:hypothetical protein